MPNTNPISLSRRASSFQESVIREMTRLGNETGAINLSQGLPDFDTPRVILEAAASAVMNGENQYTFPFGTLPFREAIAEKTQNDNHFRVNPDEEVTVTCGVSEAFACAMLGLTEPGDEVIIFQPWYENYLPDCVLAGVQPRFVLLNPETGTFDLAELRKAFSNRTRLILINTPHNPTGKVFRREELEEIARLCQEFGVIAVTDEIYEYIVYDGCEHVSLASIPGMEDRCVTVSGLGKTYAVTGWRVGWLVASAPLTAILRRVHDYLTICAPAPFQAAGVQALRLPKSYYTEMRSEYFARREILLPGLHKAGFRFTQPNGAYYVMADFANLEWDQKKYARPDWSLDRVFAEYLAREVGVAVVPGSSFFTGPNLGKNLVRFNFAKTRETLSTAVERLTR